MKSQTRAFQVSFLFHGLLIVAALVLSTHFGAVPKRLVLDFQILKPEPVREKKESPFPRPVPMKKMVQTLQNPALEEKETPKPQEEKPAPAPPAEILPLVKLSETTQTGGPSLGLGMIPQTKPLKEGVAGSPGGVAGGTIGGSPGGTGKGTPDKGFEEAKARYLKEHFTYIRDKILQNISYPTPARRLGWQGKVLVSFVITSDGSVKEMRIKQSSGFDLLDNNALETIQKSAPFPQPPLEAQLVIPILYRLD